MDLVEATQLQALLAVENQDNDFLLRRIIRWFSTTFHTPINVVEDMSLESVLQHFFEHSFDTMDKRQRNKIVRDLSGYQDLKNDDDFVEFAKKVVKDKVKKTKKRRAKVKKDIAILGEEDFLSAASVLSEVSKLRPKKAKIPPVEPLPDINMDFGSNLPDGEF
jgi:hypothetical protein